VLLGAIGCDIYRTPCEEPVYGPVGDVALIVSQREPANAKYVHLVTFEMGEVSETLQGYMILRAPDALRIYGMTETGQEAFDVASVRGKVTKIYHAPFVKDDRVLDLIVGAAAKIFLERPRQRVTSSEWDEGGVSWYWAGPNVDLHWIQGEKFSACFMDWSTEEGVYAPRRIHFHSEEGPQPYDLRMKLLKASVLPAPPPDSMFERPK